RRISSVVVADAQRDDALERLTPLRALARGRATRERQTRSMKTTVHGTGVFAVGPFVVLSACAGSGAMAPSVTTPVASVGPATRDAPLRLYALDCGRAEINDFGFFSANGKPTGEKRTRAITGGLLTRQPCSLAERGARS